MGAHLAGLFQFLGSPRNLDFTSKNATEKKLRSTFFKNGAISAIDCWIFLKYSMKDVDVLVQKGPRDRIDSLIQHP